MSFFGTVLKVALIWFVVWFVGWFVVAFLLSYLKDVIMERSYIDLMKIISFEGFDFERYYNDEVEVLQPRLEELGFKEIEWSMGEADSFGPLSRICKAKTSTGEYVYFVYG